MSKLISASQGIRFRPRLCPKIARNMQFRLRDLKIRSWGPLGQEAQQRAGTRVRGRPLPASGVTDRECRAPERIRHHRYCRCMYMYICTLQPRGPQDLILRSRERNHNFRTIFGQNRGRKRSPCDALINLDKFSASDANFEPNLA